MSNKVFVNCPFDDDFFPILKPILFTLVYLKFDPLLSETTDSSISRIDNIIELMNHSSYSIHDISKIEYSEYKSQDKTLKLPRFNMPFELGVDFGLIKSEVISKNIIVLDSERYQYQAKLSDISGSDIGLHQNDPQQAVKVIRDWLSRLGNNTAKFSEIWLAYSEFEPDLEEQMLNDEQNPDKIDAWPFVDIILAMKSWVENWNKTE